MDILPKLYTRNTNGSINVWWVELDGPQYTTSHGREGGKIQTSLPTFAKSKNTGKANETTPNEQAKIEVDALYEKQLKRNYFQDIKDVDKAWLEPQLAKPCANYIDGVAWDDGQIVDRKLNGFACIITKEGARSRKNEIYHAIPHILEELAPFFATYPNAYVQGELYNPIYVNELNKIAELIAVTRQPKDLTPELLAESKRIVEFHTYDGHSYGGINKDDIGKARREALYKAFPKQKFKYINPIDFIVCYSFDDMASYARQYIKEGGEGVIIRDPKAPYFHKRTKALLKFKKSESEEFKVISLEEGTANWTGCAKAVWLHLPNGLKDKKFKSNISGNREHLREMWENREDYVGKEITVDFQEYSPYNTPLIGYTDMVVRKDVEG